MTAKETAKEQFRVAYGKAVARAWSDSAYKDQLLRDPRAALSGVGADLPPGIEISVVENSANRMHLVLPAPPPEGEVGDEQLAAASGGVSGACCCWGD